MRNLVFLTVLCSVLPAIAQTTAPPEFHHETWGRTYYGEGYVYGPTLWRSSLAVADLDVDGDDDFMFRPHYTEAAYVMRNLGTSGAFYPGGASEVPMAPPQIGGVTVNLDVVMDFEDVTGDGLPDMLAVAYKTGDDEETYIVWYSNTGDGFLYEGLLYTSPQHALVEFALNLADINGDGLQDVFFMEPFLGTAERPHRVFQMLNTGSTLEPAWAVPVELTDVSVLLPPLMSASKSAALAGPDHDSRLRPRTAKAGGFPRVSDIELADWNVDGTLDFLFYDAEQGIDWIRNNGTATSPEWTDRLNDGMRAPWRHTPEGILDYGIPEDYHKPMDVVFGSFAVRTNPAALLPDAKWLDDFYIAMDGWLITRRYITEDNAYRLTQETCFEYASGQGPAAFWDYDGDGDLDMFRTGISDYDTRGLLLSPNIGSVYAPGWGRYELMGGVGLNPGTSDNYYRQDLYTFADPEADGYMELFVQGQDGRVRAYWAEEAAGPDLPPAFTLIDTDYAGLSAYLSGTPTGLCFADFDCSGDGELELIAAAWTGGSAKIVYYSDWTGVYDDDFIYDSEDNPIDPLLIESLAAADVDLDGRPDLIAVQSSDLTAQHCEYVVYRNVLATENGNFYFQDCGSIDEPVEQGHTYGRTITMADIDGDGDSDLFTGHQVIANTYRRNYMRFYRNGGDTGLDYWRTRVVSDQSWNLWWQGLLPTYTYVTNASGGWISDPGEYTAGETSSVVDVIESTDLDRNVRIFVDVLPPVGENESKAIIIVGGAANDSLHQTFMPLAGYAYWVLRSEGLPATNIRFLASGTMDGDEDGSDDVFAAPTLANVQAAITQWAATDCQRLLVYMIDHGRREAFRLNANQYLDAATYANWLSQLGTGTQVTTVIDTCEAGSFVNDLALTKEAIKAGAERITITSSGIGAIEGIALFDQTRYLSFSLGFWQEIFNGATYGQAFERAKVSINSINPLQVPQIDDDGDGTPNEANDGLLASTARPGADFELPTLGVCIGQIAPLQVVSSNSATLWLSDVSSSFPVEAAGALIVPPNFQRPSLTGDDEQPVTGLEWLDLTFNEAAERWQGVFTGLNEGGLFRIQYYVKAAGRWYVSPRIGYVDRKGIADAWEPDNSAGAAQWLPANSVQGHNFHASGDVDWLRFTSPPQQEVTFAAIAPSHRCQPVVALYAQNNLTTPLREVTAAAPGKSVVFNHVFATAGEYLIRVSNATGLFGEGTSYMALAAVGTGGSDIVPSTLLVTVLESGGPASGASVRFNDTVTCTTGSDGTAQFLCTGYGSYPVEVNKAGYDAVSQTVTVNNLFEAATITLGTNNDDDEPGGGCAGGLTSGGPTRGAPGAAVLLLAAAIMAVSASNAKRTRATSR